MTLGQFTEPTLLIPCLFSSGQEGVIQELVRQLEVTGRVDNARVYSEALLHREADLPTFVGQNVAVPHLRAGALKQISLAVGMSQTGIPWGRFQSRIAKVVFLVAVPLKEAATYISLLSGLSRLIHDDTVFNAFRRVTQPEQMLSVLNGVRLVERTIAPASRP